jgi:hypothetical protein
MDAANPHQSLKGIRSEPLFVALRLKTCRQIFDFTVTRLLIEIHKKVGITKVAVVLENFVFENEVITPGIPGQPIDHSMILMEIVTGVGEYQIGGEGVFQTFKVFFDFHTFRREKTVAEVEDRDVLMSRPFQKERGALSGFIGARNAGTENHPVKVQIAAVAKQFEDRGAAADLNIVGMSS